ncbi:hypothetical protein V6255_11850 [Psychromonas arctica]|uniref:Curli production assembly/transport component CsgG n=1 Tax=Psychromonas arctica TaxID=168275 RepID=A0ABU9HDL0_9GAMM
MKKKLLVVAISATLGLTGCMSTTENIRDYSDVSMQKADILPTKEVINGAKQKIVIFTADTSNSPLAETSHAGTTIATSLETYLAEVGVEIVDRNIASKLRKELALAESKGKSEYNGPDIANYAITGSISNANISYSFNEKHSWVDSDGDRHVNAAYCRFKANVSANLKLYKLPGLAYSKTITTNETVSMKTETTNSRCPISEAAATSLVREAAKEGVEDNKAKFQNFFSPKAYVLERKVNGSKSLFKISAGKNFGFIPESTITFYNLEVKANPLTGDVSTEEYAIVEGTVTANLIGDKFAWILVDDELADQVKIGDYVKVKYSSGFLTSFSESTKSLGNGLTSMFN